MHSTGNELMPMSRWNTAHTAQTATTISPGRWRGVQPLGELSSVAHSHGGAVHTRHKLMVLSRDTGYRAGIRQAAHVRHQYRRHAAGHATHDRVRERQQQDRIEDERGD